MSNDIIALRAALFDTLRSLKDRDSPIDIERAKAINETAQVIINSVKLEIDRMRIAGGDRGTDFIPVLPAPETQKVRQQDGGTTERQTQNGRETVTPIQGGVVRRHVLR
jgi:hypothetical protein